MSKPLLTIVIVSWNVSDYLAQSLASIPTEVKGQAIEVIVVDNGSVDDTLLMLDRQFPNVKVIANRSNPGFAYACNQGMKIAQGDYILLLNPDTVLFRNSLEPLLDLLASDATIGLVGPRLFHHNGETQATCARRIPGLPYGLLVTALAANRVPVLGKHIVRAVVSPYDYNVRREVQAILGAFMLFPRTLIARIGYLDERFKLCGEDIDWCRRVREAGLKVMYVPEAMALHYGGQSMARSVNWKSINNSIVSNYLYLQKHESKLNAGLYRLIIAWVMIPRLALSSHYRAWRHSKSDAKADSWQKLIAYLKTWRFAE